MKNKLKDQVEQIIDEGRGKQRKVIISMVGSHERDSALFDAASGVLRERSLLLSPRDVLPVSQKVMKKIRSRRTKSAAKRRLVSASASLAARLATSSLRTQVKQGMKRASMDLLKPLLADAVVKKSLSEQVASKKKSKLRKRPLDALWASESLSLTMDKDDLAKLPTAVPAIQGIYRNRRLRTPRVVELKSLPSNVTDNKTSSWGINASGALATWGAYGFRGEGVKVGVLDTGVDATHPDLNGKISDWAEFDFDGLEVPGSTPHDSDRHGTHVSGTVAGGDTSGQWIGMAPDAKIAAALVLKGEQGGTDAQVLAGISWALDQGVDVISMSLGGLTLDAETPPTYTRAILNCVQAGVPVVIAIGNEGNQTSGSPGNDLFAFSVGATDWDDRPAGFSGGRTQLILDSPVIPPEFLPLPYSKPDLSAPGVGVVSSVPGGGWEAFNGTSMATPHVAGAIAVMLSATSIRTEVPVEERAFLIQDLLIGAVEELGESGQDHRYGFGRLDLLRAVGFAWERGLALG